MSVTEMHGNIIQISETPLTEGDHITYDEMPEWFTNSIADYGGEEREYDNLADYVTVMYPFKAQGDGFVLDKERVVSYFKYKMDVMHRAIQTLSEMTFEDFIDGDADQPSYEVRNAVADRYGTYVCEGHCDVIMFDRWLRCQFKARPDKKFYIGAVLDYHY